jgi:NAD(P)-dependent dehydrogenase (short-subunit alcohol dehydrogenase family)
MKNVVIFGATGGLGSQISHRFTQKNEYNLFLLGSKDIDISNYYDVKNFFDNNNNDLLNIKNQIDVNINGNINIISSCLNKMREKKYGRIILFSSVLAEKPVVSTSIYSGCKGFIDSFSKTVALENASKNITCNTIQLGYFDGGLTYKIPSDFLNKLTQEIPSKRLGTIDELENTILFLINTPYINGINLKINGGIDF